MTLAGGWMRSNAAVNPMFSRWTTVDPRHSVKEEPDERREESIIHGTPQAPGGSGEFVPFDGSGSGERIDKTPSKNHNTVRTSTPNASEDELGALHHTNLGAARAQTTTHARLMKWGDSYQILSTQDMAAPPNARGAMDRPDLVRGLNAFDQNNPPKTMYGGEGWRRAIWHKHVQDHDLSIPQRFHRFRIIWRDETGAKTATNVPGMKGPYNVPWGSLSKTIKNNFARPRLRRTPGLIDESIMTDGTETPSPVAAGGAQFY